MMYENDPLVYFKNTTVDIKEIYFKLCDTNFNKCNVGDIIELNEENKCNLQIEIIKKNFIKLKAINISKKE